MGPLISALSLAVAGTLCFGIVFLIARLRFRRLLAALFSAVVVFTFGAGIALAVVVGFLLMGTATLATDVAVVTYLSALLGSGLVAACLAGWGFVRLAAKCR